MARHAARFRKSAEARRRAADDERAGLTAALRQAEAEEARLLDAYRRGIISAAQLGEQLTPLNERLGALRAQVKTDSVQDPPPASADGRAAELRGLVGQRMSDLSVEKRQRVLRALVRTITFCGDTVRIEGVAPSDECGIVPMQIDRHGRNAANEFHRPREPLEVPFEIVRKLPPPLPRSRPWHSVVSDIA